MNSSTTVLKIAPALLKAQRSMGDATKGSKNPFFKSSYADLNAIRETVIPVLNENGITVLQPTVTIEGRNFVQTLLLHESGEFLSSLTEIKSLKPNDPQAEGSGISYARRYGLQSFLNVGAVDDDGNAASDKKVETPSATFRKPEKVAAATVTTVTTPVKPVVKGDGWV